MAKKAREGIRSLLKNLVMQFLETVDRILKQGKSEEEGAGVVEKPLGLPGAKAAYKYKIKLLRP